MSVVPRRKTECECSDCGWQGLWRETDAGSCPECGAECFDFESDDDTTDQPGEDKS